MKKWSNGEIALVREMHASGASSAEIARVIGRTPCAVRSEIRYLGLAQPRRQYLSAFFAGPPIEHCSEQKRLIRNAIEGSAKLRDAILAAAA